MIKFSPVALAIISSIILSGCGSLNQALPVINPDIPSEWDSKNESSSELFYQEVPREWSNIFLDPVLRELIDISIKNNRDSRVAVLNVKRAKALYQVQEGAESPSLSAGMSMNRSNSGNGISNSWTGLFSTSYEIDLFNRLGSLSDAALYKYKAEKSEGKAVMLIVAGEVSNSYVQLQANKARYALAISTLNNREHSLELTKKRYELGAVSELVYLQEMATVGSAKSDVQHYLGQIEINKNAIRYLAGANISSTLLSSVSNLGTDVIIEIPNNINSEILLSRPDVKKSEELLLSANANIGAARAALYPSIQLTGNLGTMSADFSNLLGAGTGVWQFSPQINIPIFNGRALKSNVKVAQLDQDIALARYEKTIQQGFKEVADSLYLKQSIDSKKKIQIETVNYYLKAQKISSARYKAGQDSYIVLLDTERSLYAAQQALITTILDEQINKIALYKSTGGGL